MIAETKNTTDIKQDGAQLAGVSQAPNNSYPPQTYPAAVQVAQQAKQWKKGPSTTRVMPQTTPARNAAKGIAAAASRMMPWPFGDW